MCQVRLKIDNGKPSSLIFTHLNPNDQKAIGNPRWSRNEINQKPLSLGSTNGVGGDQQLLNKVTKFHHGLIHHKVSFGLRDLNSERMLHPTFCQSKAFNKERSSLLLPMISPSLNTATRYQRWALI